MLNTTTRLMAGILFLGVIATGCQPAAPNGSEPTPSKRILPSNTTRRPDTDSSSGSAPSTTNGVRKALNRNNTLFLETLPDGKKRVALIAEVVLTEGPIELFLCKKMSKEHEAILAADVDARQVHAALNAIGAKEGKPVSYQPKYTPATGDVIRVLVQYEKDGEIQTVPAQSWVRNVRTKKALAHDWVFAGSRLDYDPEDSQKPPVYAANFGDIICVSNFDTAMLDLPIASPKGNNDLAFEAFTQRIPKKETKVTVLLEKAEPKAK